MALEKIKIAQEKYVPKDNEFYKLHYHHILYGMIATICFLLAAVGFVLYQVSHLPLPEFVAKQDDGRIMSLQPYEEPNLLPDTIIRWASKAATTAYTFDFVNYNKEISMARSYFTEAGWSDFQGSISGVITTIVQNQLFVSGVVAGTPVISNQGVLPNKGYTWRVQIPFLVNYQSANTTTKRNYFVIITLVRVPTYLNPQGIGIDQFVMV